MGDNKEFVTLTVDGVQVEVVKGTSLIEAARQAGVEIPYYCYHPHLSVAGNCRMCQIEVEGMPKLTIGCNTIATDGMVVKTQNTSTLAAEAQRATLEFILVNHPLDCTVCDQAGHCKLQDYYYKYNAKASRFCGEKRHKPKALPLGPDVILDAERCILCTRCVRYCDEITGTSELGVFNRGDSSVLGTYEGVELDNPLSATVVDLCPVGALTHRKWRFNSRIWYTKESSTICTGCSTGCNVTAAVRDQKIVHVKARLNSEVNFEWMCNEGRYGFERFQPAKRLLQPVITVDGERKSVEWQEALTLASKLGDTKEQKEAADEDDSRVAIFLSPFLTLEEVWACAEFIRLVMEISPQDTNVAVQFRKRELSELQKKLISPDWVPNGGSAVLFGIGGVPGDDGWRRCLEEGYLHLLEKVRSGTVTRVLMIGDGAVLDVDIDEAFENGVKNAALSVALTSRAIVDFGAHSLCQVVLPTKTVNEKNGVMLNKDFRFQRINSILDAPSASKSEWLVLKDIAQSCKKELISDSVIEERALFRHIVANIKVLSELSLTRIGESGVAFSALRQSLEKSELEESTVA